MPDLKAERKKIIEEMYIRATAIVNKMQADYSVDPTISTNSIGERISWDLSSLAIAHLSNYVQNLCPDLKQELLRICAMIADIELADRALKNGMAPIQKEQSNNTINNPHVTGNKNIN